jgi:hypothetical protein
VSGGYRFGFQSQEKDDEVKGEGNSVNYSFRMHDPRLGRFFAVDPLIGKYPFYSSYSFSGNRVIDAIELEGLEPNDVKDGVRILVVVILGYSDAEEPPRGKTLYKNNPNAQPDNAEGIPFGLSKMDESLSSDKTQVYVYSSSLVDSKTKADAEKTMGNFMRENPDGKIVLVGHSKGADIAVNIANDNPNMKIELLYTIDIADDFPTGWDDDNVSSNVKYAINVFQDKETLGGEDIEINDPCKTIGFNYEATDKGISHANIDNMYTNKAINRVQRVINGKAPLTNKEINKLKTKCGN